MSTENSYATLGFYHQLSKLRSDNWNRLNEELARCPDSDVGGDARSDGGRKFKRSVAKSLKSLQALEDFNAFPSKKDFQYLWNLFDRGDYRQLGRTVNRIVQALTTRSYRRRPIVLEQSSAENQEVAEQIEAIEHHHSKVFSQDRPYFELLIVDNFASLEEEEAVRSAFLDLRKNDDPFVYDVVAVSSYEDALLAILSNPNIQACVIRYRFPFKGNHEFEVLSHVFDNPDFSEITEMSETDRSIHLGATIKQLRPELDLYLVTNLAVEETASRSIDYFRRIFYREPGYIEHHHSILRGVNERYNTPFFSALTRYSKRPTGVFHALPISRGKSVLKSNWIGDMADFYGLNIFLAETSATSGGLDSLLQPHGPMKRAQEKAARAFGARETYFVTNGTSTANKVVVQALVKPNDIVLVDRDCHKSHHYAMVLAGAHVDYLDSYPLNEYSMYGAVPIREIKRKLLAYKRAGRLDEVKMLILTNCTFDGIVYNVRRVMEECLAIKPDLIFLWDEAWFAFATFNPLYRRRTAMYSANAIKQQFKSEEYAVEYRAFRDNFDQLDPELDETWLDTRLKPDPGQARIRCYSTHSTHKTLTSLRQGSMIHVWDEDFRQKSIDAFHEAYMTHTSTSPNYQILASLDVGRRQVELEGYELVHKQIETAMTLREQISRDPKLAKHFRILLNADLIPAEHRASGVESYYDPDSGWSKMEEAWKDDEFVVDPTRITLYVGATGVDGDTFKNQFLMDKFGIQINKTSRNTVLFMTNIGTNRSSIAYLIDVLGKIARGIEERYEDSSLAERALIDQSIIELTEDLPPLPDFSKFHPVFSPSAPVGTTQGDIRSAYFLCYDEQNLEYLRIDNGELQRQIQAGREVVSANFIIPYPPGFPILVPGQVISEEILEFLLRLDVKEIHGYRPELGIQVIKDSALEGKAVA